MLALREVEPCHRHQNHKVDMHICGKSDNVHKMYCDMVADDGINICSSNWGGRVKSAKRKPT